MSQPKLRAEGIIIRKDGLAILVQCDNEESFYRFPGGSIEFEETAAEAIKRELVEEFDMQAEIGALACLNESIVTYDGRKRHDCTILHWCSIDDTYVSDSIGHKEHAGIKLTWRSLEQLKQRPLYPEGILDFISEKVESVAHIVIRKKYD
ncbi:NUDIX domain-containing protein [Paenibacillus sp. N3/727]|uniref:NUDIX domain-containing protein n=1 Tax=Paenibacillus sp. N3/727 TaxID=2925845 RepID=UPI001F536694|nr:NUDIX domain-containing protein [Paenibacillus sp. N3/727]UNK21111.1 NUDIX domain-containing protein [Paenibacillus sp. N3/727]